MARSIADCPALVADIITSPADVIVRSPPGGVTVELTCMSGYVLHGNRQLTCANGTWNAEPPVCVRQHGPLMTANYGAGERNSTTYGRGEYGGLTLQQLIVITSCCAACLFVVLTLLAIVGAYRYRQKRRSRERRLAATIKLPPAIGSSSSSCAATSCDNGSFLYEHVGSEPNYASASAIGSPPSISWSSERMAWHDEFDYSRVKLPRPQLVTLNSNVGTYEPDATSSRLPQPNT